MTTARFKFMVDHNAGKLAKWLRMVGYDTILFTGPDDSDMVDAALKEQRIILTRDTQIPLRRVAVNGQLRVILIESDKPEEQINQITRIIPLHKGDFRPFSLCMEDNEPLLDCIKDEIRERIPSYVFQTQKEFVECPVCRRIYWKGTHWENMVRKLEYLQE